LKTFLAFTPPPETITAIDEWRRLNWPLLEHSTPARNYHTTLVFTGETTPSEVQRLHDQLISLAAPAFSLTLSTLGFWQKAGIFWLGSTHPPSELMELAKLLRKNCRQADISIEKREYIPHLTLARRCGELPLAPLIEPDFTFAIDHFTLFESVRAQARIVYRPLFEFPLQR